MDAVLTQLQFATDFLLGLGNMVLLPIIIFLLAVFWFKVKASEAFNCALKIGIGYVAISLVTNYFAAEVGGVIQTMVTRFGLSTTTLDIGSAGSKFVAFGTPVALFYIPLAIIANLVLLMVKGTKTLNLDIWNFWHFAFAGGLVYVASGSLLWGCAAVVIFAVVILLVADKTQNVVAEYYDLPGISIPHGTTQGFALLGWPIAKLIDLIPGLKNINVTAQSIEKKLGVLGNTPVIGMILSIIFSFLAGNPLNLTLQVGVKTAAIFYLIPKMCGILVEGLLPIADAAKDVFTKKYGTQREVFIGLDSALLLGDSAVMAVAMIMMPISIVLALILPGNTFLPFTDFALFPFLFALVVPMCKGNIVKSVLVGSVLMIVGLYSATYLAPIFTDAAVMGGYEATGQLVSSCLDSAVPLNALLTWLGSLF